MSATLLILADREPMLKAYTYRILETATECAKGNALRVHEEVIRNEAPTMDRQAAFDHWQACCTSRDKLWLHLEMSEGKGAAEDLAYLATDWAEDHPDGKEAVEKLAIAFANSMILDDTPIPF